MLVHILALFTLFSSSISFANPKLSGATDPWTLIIDEMGSENYLGAKLLLERNCQAYFGSTEPSASQGYYENYLEVLANLGEHANVLKSFDRAYPKADLAPLFPSNRASRPLDAVDEITNAAKTRQVVMINELHGLASHRAFAIRVLHRLRLIGYQYFAVEGLFVGPYEDTALSQRRYPVRKTGMLPNEPVFGDLLRIAIRLGYQIVPYEMSLEQAANYDPKSPTPSDITNNERDRIQAANIVNRVLKQHPQAKILVYAGGSHPMKRPDTDGSIRMGKWFMDMTGIDPLSIDQTSLNERSLRKLESRAYGDLADRQGLNTPKVLRSQTERSGYDIHIFHPRTRYEFARPSWMRLGGIRAPVRIPESVCRNSYPCVVEARFASEGTDAVPVDRILIETGTEIRESRLFLPRGRFSAQAYDSTGSLLGNSLIDQ